MPVHSIQMVSFRNHEKLEMEFSAGINVIWGENGSGKTAVLEAIHLLSIGKSFRTNRTSEIIKHENDTFRVEGVFLSKTKSACGMLPATKSLYFSKSEFFWWIKKRLRHDNGSEKACFFKKRVFFCGKKKRLRRADGSEKAYIH